MATCAYCDNDPCFCGKKKNTFQCEICREDVPLDQTLWAPCSTGKKPVHKSCYDTLTGVSNKETSVNPEEKSSLLLHQVVMDIAYRVGIPVFAGGNEELQIKEFITKFLSTLILAYQNATFTFSPLSGEVKMDNFRFEEMLRHEMEQEKERLWRTNKKQ